MGQIGRQGAHGDVLAKVQQGPAHLLHGVRFAHVVDGHVHVELLGHLDHEEVDMDGMPLHGVLVDALQQHRHGTAATDLEIHQRVARSGAAQLVEGARIDLDGLRLAAVAVDDGGHEALAAQRVDLLAKDLAGLGSDDGAGAHVG